MINASNWGAWRRLASKWVGKRSPLTATIGTLIASKPGAALYVQLLRSAESAISGGKPVVAAITRSATAGGGVAAGAGGRGGGGEQILADETGRLSLVVGPHPGHRGVGLRGILRLLDVEERVDGDEADDAVPQPLRRLQDHRPPHRVADENHAVELQPVRHRLHVLAEGLHRVVLPRAAGAAMARQVQGHDLVGPGQPGDLVLPEAAVAGPAVDEDQGRTPPSRGLVVDGDAVR